jgi:hypothetical protein
MKSGEVVIPIQKRRAVERGRKISNLTISLILSFVVTAAAQSERINREGRILGAASVVTSPTLAIINGLSRNRDYALGE